MPTTIKPLMTAGVLALSVAGSALVTAGSPALAVRPADQPTGSAQHGAHHHAHHHAHRGGPAATAPGYGLRLTTFNIEASPMKPGGVSRARRAAHWVEGQHATAAAFQEVAADQLRTLQHHMPGYRFWPRREFGTRGSAIQIAWRTKKLAVTRTGHVSGPFLGYRRAIPYVQLRDRRTHRTFWVMAVHNAPGSHEGERDAETRIEIARLRKLLRTDDPVFAVGDVNERSEWCDKLARATVLHSLDGGTPHRSCPVPRTGGPDWMLGAGARTTDFAKVYNHISDHPGLTVYAHVPAAR